MMRCILRFSLTSLTLGALLSNVVIQGQLAPVALDGETAQTSVLGAPVARYGSVETVRDPALEKLVAGNTAFALDLFARLGTESPETNINLAPYSLSTALAMTYAGARGDTAAQMRDTLRFDPQMDALHDAFESLTLSILRANGPREVGSASPALELAMANRLWAQAGEPFLQSFIDVMRADYGGAFEWLDFDTQSEHARWSINSWIAQQTGGAIPELIYPHDLQPTPTLVLTNAVYFSGAWHVQFDPADTRSEPFYSSSSKEVSTPMMHLKDAFPFHETESVQVLELPYDGKRLAMMILLPKARDGLADLEASLTAEQLAQWIDRLRPAKIDLSMPRFRSESRLYLGNHLSAMGMPLAFTGAADFSGINGRANDLFISKAIHGATVELTEEGTVAAGTTAVIMGRGDEGRLRSLNANHPFVYCVRDRETGSILFLGRMFDPTS